VPLVCLLTPLPHVLITQLGALVHALFLDISNP
jgi:hypothetical protein